MRSAVISADRIVSSWSAQELEDVLSQYRASPSTAGLEAMPGMPDFSADSCAEIRAQGEAIRLQFEADCPGSERNTQQTTAAVALAKTPISVLQGPAGCGKTKIMLQYLVATAKTG